MVTFNKEKQENAHKELHKKIHGCDCKPWRKLTRYCLKCEVAILEFLNNCGAGVLTRDQLIEDSVKENIKLKQDNKSLSNKLEAKIKRVEELKKKLEQKDERA